MTTALFRNCFWTLLACLVALSISKPLLAGGGMVLRDDKCIIEIGFYDAHFTAYQPETRGNEQFCQELPEIGETLFVLDYLHGSMKEVPIDFRIIKDTTNMGRFVQLSDIVAIQDIEPLTVFYHEPTIHSDASMSVDHTFAEGGKYIGIVTAGHPTKDTTYGAVFPFTVGRTGNVWIFVSVGALVLVLAILYFFLRRRRAQTS